MNKRGSVLASVLVITTVLMIFALVMLRMVAADSRFALADNNRTRALQMAEGGIDFGIEQIVACSESGTPLLSEYGPADNLTVEITDLGSRNYLINSTAVYGNSTRSIEVEVAYNPMDSPFSYSLFTSGKIINDKEELKNVTFESPVFFGGNYLSISDVTFNADVYFKCQPEDINGTFTLGPGANVYYGVEVTFPEVDLETFAAFAENNDPYNTENNMYSSTVQYENLCGVNFYYGDVDIVWGGGGSVASPAGATEGYVMIVSLGGVTLAGDGNLEYTPMDAIVIFCNGNITGANGEDIQSVNLPLYLYSRSYIKANNNLKNIRSFISEEGLRIGNGTNTVSRLDVEIPGLDVAWPSPITIKRWKN